LLSRTEQGWAVSGPGFEPSPEPSDIQTDRLQRSIPFLLSEIFIPFFYLMQKVIANIDCIILNFLSLYTVRQIFADALVNQAVAAVVAGRVLSPTGVPTRPDSHIHFMYVFL
jgi:hypothetical protein